MFEDTKDEEDCGLYEDFYHLLLKEYVALADSPYILERICMKLYRMDRFCSHIDLDILRDMMVELQS
ncbi:MAG TPA: hypothetical protein VJ863_07525 [Sphaerochaeta sp.]|nr:hypothetical protein [Sphaerochaeta sp.]